MNKPVFPEQVKEQIEYYTAHGYNRNETLFEWLQYAADEFGKEAAIISADRIISYAGLYKQVRYVASGLAALKLGPRDVIAVQLPNTPEFIISYLAIAAIGAVMQTLHMPYRTSELRYLLDDSKAKAVICLSEFKSESPAANILKIATELDSIPQVISVGTSIPAALDFDSLLQGQMLEQSPSKADDPFVLLYTSGTTSSPKGVPHRYNNFLSNARLCCEEYRFNQHDRLLSVAPMTHLYGLFTYNMTLAASACAVLLPAFNPQDFVSTVATQRVSAIFAAPAHFAAASQARLLKQQDFSSVKFVCLSGSHVPADLAAEVDNLLLNGKVGQLWGMSELQAGAITRLDETAAIRCNFSGRATPGTELRVVDSEDNPLPANGEGELQVKGLSVFNGYLNRTEESRSAFTQDHWFRTGDLATLDERGYLTITGRTKNLINRGGVKFNPLEIETIISSMEQVSQCAIIPRADAVLGEIAVVFVVAGNDKSVSLSEICTVLDKAGVAKYKWPEQLFLIDSMPMTPTNKVKIEELGKLLH